ncbi:hypothetical protein L915_21404 [Phytophthora nicotianae]|uniref:Uncharacterized protein n=1 Tax=Phytophthora nicotianae TaxID=4792 RepID=W2FKN7_PHYNI|nr:hypothetical protein L915_21404 [Phytophthora nicotianae]
MAVMIVNDERLGSKLNSGARNSVADTDWLIRNEQLRQLAPVECVEGIDSFQLTAHGVGAFHMRNAFGQLVDVQACIVDGVYIRSRLDESTHGKPGLRTQRGPLRCHIVLVVIPFRTEGGGGPKVAA